MMILPMLFRLGPMLDGEFRTVVEAPQALIAFRLGPRGSPVSHLYGGIRAAFRAQAASDAGVFHRELRRLAHALVVKIHDGNDEAGNLAWHALALFAVRNGLAQFLYLHIRRAVCLLHAPFVA